MKFRLLSLLLFFPVSIFAQSQKDSTVVFNTDSLIVSDSIKIAKTTNDSVLDSTIAIKNPELPTAKEPISKDSALVKSDTTLPPLNGLFLGVSIGITLGSFPITDLWKNSLPDSLSSFGLATNSFIIKPDTTLPDSLRFADTSALIFKIKEQPNIYNMTFPIRLSVSKIREHDQLGASLAFSLINKQFKGSVYTLNDSLEQRIDIKEKLGLYSLALEFSYAREIPPQYFSIESFEKSNFVIGAGVSPLLSIRRTNSLVNHSSDIRMKEVYDSMSVHMSNNTSYGVAVTLRAGVSAIRRLQSGNGTEIGVFYTFNRFDYFHSNGNRTHTTDIDPSINEHKRLSFLSNRFEIIISFLRNVNRSKK